jgi:hypothetical protein
MWGVSGTVILGAKIEVPVDQQLALLEFLKGIHEAKSIVHLSGDKQGVSLWFSGPRQAGDFVARWKSITDPITSAPIRPLKPPGQYIAIRPDDMLSVQEWHMASEGMDTYSVCPSCQATLEALAEDRVLSRIQKEVVIRTAVCSVFCNSAGLVNWTRTELDCISRMWTRAYKQACVCMDSSPIIVDQSVGGRGCPSAVNLWTRAVQNNVLLLVCPGRSRES